MTLRAIVRAWQLASAVFVCFLHYALVRAKGTLDPIQQAQWMHESCRIVADALGIQLHIRGPAPARGTVVSNHLSYLDILVIGAATPCFFIAKDEIQGWPVFGWAARLGGTIFLDRSSKASTKKVASLISDRLALPVPVVLFPEGTTTDGSSLMRFRPRLLEPAVRSAAPITCAALRYSLGQDHEEREVCWVGDAAFLPHLWHFLGLPQLVAEVRFGEPHIYTSAWDASLQTHDAVSAMRAQNILATIGITCD